MVPGERQAERAEDSGEVEDGFRTLDGLQDSRLVGTGGESLATEPASADADQSDEDSEEREQAPDAIFEVADAGLEGRHDRGGRTHRLAEHAFGGLRLPADEREARHGRRLRPGHRPDGARPRKIPSDVDDIYVRKFNLEDLPIVVLAVHPKRGVFAGYSGTPIARKLGIKADAVVVLVDAPPRFAETLPDLPPGIVFRERARGPANLAIWFVETAKSLRARIRKLAALAEGGALWIAWPKKASGVETDLSERVVRETGLANGLVDYKICAIDETWSGLKFATRRNRG